MMPFDKYPNNGRLPLGNPPNVNGGARRDYGPTTFRMCGFVCVYCGQDLQSRYESWLSISVDHVVPKRPMWSQQGQGWIEDTFNRVTCCRACNEFLQQDDDWLEPETVDAFVSLRDKIFVDKRAKAIDRHAEEWKWYIEHVR